MDPVWCDVASKSHTTWGYNTSGLVFFPCDLHFFLSFLMFHLMSLLNNQMRHILTCQVSQTLSPDNHVSPHFSTLISVSASSDCGPIPGSGTSTVGCNCSTLHTWELLQPPNELSQNLTWNYMEVNGKILTGSVRLLCKDNLLQIDDYQPKIIIMNIWIRLPYWSDIIWFSLFPSLDYPSQR